MSALSFEEKLAACPPALRETIAEFQEASPSERIDYMVDYAESLPDLPERLRSQRDRMEQVHECLTPVFLHTEAPDGRVHFYFDIPRESPTVRGYASILAAGLNGCTPAEVLALPDDIYYLLGLHEALTHQRLRGLHALLIYMKRQVQALET